MISATKELRKLLDEHGIKHQDIENMTYWNRPGHDVSFDYADFISEPAKSTPVHLQTSIDELLDVSVIATPEQAIAATLGSDNAFTSEEVESAFVCGYSLGSLPVGSDPRWNENIQTVDEHMAELGWVRAATLGSGTLTAEQVREAVMSADRWKKPMGNTGLTNTHLIIRDDEWQAIADELNARTERTCENIADEKAVNFECSECGCSVYGGDELGANIENGRWNCCPNCKARVVSHEE